jgi:hypothetical protein
MKWRPLVDVERFFDEGMFSSTNFGWDLAVDLYEKNGNIIAEMNLP